MKLLLDTQAFLWMLNDDKRLSQAARHAIDSPHAEVFLSAASVWEISIKSGLNKLQLPLPLAQCLKEIKIDGLQSLPVAWQHAVAVQALPPLHKDPFDRMLVAQAMVEDMTLVSSDNAFKNYPVKVLW